MIGNKNTTDKPSKAIEYLRQLHAETPSDKFVRCLSSLATGKKYSLEVFIAGVETFTQIANLSPSERAAFYGNSFAGLYDNNDLAKLWNRSSSETIEAYRLNLICPHEWDYQLEDCYQTLVYKGDKPSAALDKLLQGPTVIDCGMFCQLSIWFGIRYMLGDDVFNDLFGRTPFYLTQLVYNPIESPFKPYTGNPLYPFFQQDSSEQEKTSDVYITHVKNHEHYQLKHPGGNYGGDNCVVLRGTYTIFDTMLENTSGLNRNDIKRLLIRALMLRKIPMTPTK